MVLEMVSVNNTLNVFWRIHCCLKETIFWILDGSGWGCCRLRYLRAYKSFLLLPLCYNLTWWGLSIHSNCHSLLEMDNELHLHATLAIMCLCGATKLLFSLHCWLAGWISTAEEDNALFGRLVNVGPKWKPKSPN